MDHLARRVQSQEAALRERHVDYTETLARAGIWWAVQRQADGLWTDPGLAEEIYSAPDPPKRAYKIAREIVAGLRPPPSYRVVPVIQVAPLAEPADPPPPSLWRRCRAAWRTLRGQPSP